MADPPKPYDALTLAFECAAHGGIEKCGFLFPAGCRLRTMPELKRPTWVIGAHVRTVDNYGSYLEGEAAVLAIASQQLSIQYPAQIVGIRACPSARVGREICCCPSCTTQRNLHGLTKLIGQAPPSEDP